MSNNPEDILEDLLPKEDELLKNLGRAIIDIADYTVDRIKERTRVDTGYLRNSIHWSNLNTSGNSVLSVEVGTNVEYGVWQEYGNSRMSGARMFRDGIEVSRPWAEQRLVQALDNST